MPEPLWLITTLTAGFLLGLVTTLLLLRGRTDTAREAGRQEQAPALAALEARLTGREEQLRQQEQELKELASRLERLTQEKADLESSRASLQTQLKAESVRSEEKLQVLNEAKEALQNQFTNLANRIFEEKTRAFADQSKANLATILTPFREKIAEFENKVTEAYDKEGKERYSLIQEVKRLQQLNQQISEDADNLTRALKGDTQTQGAWGELILERILEESGLRRGIEYDAQGGFRDTEGKLLKPDVIVHLPEGKEIIIDSKVSLVAYERYVRANEAPEKERAVKEHLASINAHLKGLSEKKYDELLGGKSLDFVLMFIPLESAFMLAIEKDNEIFRKAFDQNIMIVCPSTLLVTLRTIENIWRYEHQNRNALEIADQAGNLYEKFVGFVDDLEKIGAQVDNTRKAYEAAHNKLASGRGNLVNRTQNLIKLGVKSRKKLSEQLVQQAEDETLFLDQQGDDEG